MKSDDAWQGWLAHNRERPPPEGLSDRVLARVQAVPVQRASPSWRERWSAIALWTAATIVCAVRIYCTVGVLVPAFAFASPPVPSSPSAGERARERGPSVPSADNSLAAEFLSREAF